MPAVKVSRPFTGMMETGLKFQAPKPIQSAAIAKINPEDARMQLYESVKDKNSQLSLQFGKCIVNTRFKDVSNSSIVNVAALVEAAPQPKVKKSKKKKDEGEKAVEESPDAKKPKKKAKKSDAPDLAPPRIAVADLTCED